MRKRLFLLACAVVLTCSVWGPPLQRGSGAEKADGQLVGRFQMKTEAMKGIPAYRVLWDTATGQTFLQRENADWVDLGSPVRGEGEKQAVGRYQVVWEWGVPPEVLLLDTATGRHW